MKFLSAIGCWLLVVGCWMFPVTSRAVDVQWIYTDFTSQTQALRRIYITPLQPYGVSGMNIITADRRIYTNDSSGSLIVSNITVGMSYRVEFFGSYALTTITNCFDASASGFVNATNYLCSGLTLSGAAVAYSDNRYYPRTTNPAGYLTDAEVNTNSVSVAPGLRATASTNSGVVTLTPDAQTNAALAALSLNDGSALTGVDADLLSGVDTNGLVLKTDGVSVRQSVDDFQNTDFGNILYVHTNGAHYSTRKPGATYRTILGAVTNSQSGDTVHVLPGVHFTDTNRIILKTNSTFVTSAGSIIVSSNNSTSLPLAYASIVPSDDCFIHWDGGMSNINVGANCYSLPFGSGYSDPRFNRVTIKGKGWINNDSDCITLFSTNGGASSIIIDGLTLIAGFDCFNSLNTNNQVVIRNSALLATNESSFSVGAVGTRRGAGIDSEGVLQVENCYFKSLDTIGTNRAIAWGVSGKSTLNSTNLIVINCVFDVGGHTNTSNRDIYIEGNGSGGGTTNYVRSIKNVRSDGQALKVWHGSAGGFAARKAVAFGTSELFSKGTVNEPSIAFEYYRQIQGLETNRSGFYSTETNIIDVAINGARLFAFTPGGFGSQTSAPPSNVTVGTTPPDFWVPKIDIRTGLTNYSPVWTNHP